MKNLKLLLATTAMLSIGSSAVFADADSVSTTLRASINILDPFTMNSSGGEIIFPSITLKEQPGADSIKVTVKPDGTIDQSKTNAQILMMSRQGKVVNSQIKPIIISGGNIKYQVDDTYSNTNTDEEIAAKDIANTQADGGFHAYNIVLSSNEIPMQYDDDSPLCGTVSDLTRSWHYNKTNKSIELRFGGTFELYKDNNGYFEIQDADLGGIECFGKITVTLITY